MNLSITGEIIVTNNEHCHTEIRQHLRKDYKLNKLNRLNSQYQEFRNMVLPQANQANSVIATTTTSIIRGVATISNAISKKPTAFPQQKSERESPSRSPSPSPIVPLSNSTPTNYSFPSSGHNSNTHNE